LLLKAYDRLAQSRIGASRQGRACALRQIGWESHSGQAAAGRCDLLVPLSSDTEFEPAY